MVRLSIIEIDDAIDVILSGKGNKKDYRNARERAKRHIKKIEDLLS